MTGEKKSVHLVVVPNGRYGVCDHCLQETESLYDFHVNKSRTEKRCAGCLAEGLGASYEIREEVQA